VSKPYELEDLLTILKGFVLPPRVVAMLQKPNLLIDDELFARLKVRSARVVPL
jgi:hypothetical protein